MKLNLGCAFNHMADAENVDISPLCKPDRIVDLEKFPWPWADGSVDEICMYHSLEHLGADPEVFLGIMRELYRVLKPAGEVHIQVPHPRHDNYINSPTHVRPVTSITLQQFSQEWNRKTRHEGYANETFGQLLGVDFKITENHLVIAKPWWEKYQRGQITKDELEFAVASYWNVIEECRITIEKVPLSRQ
jgi:SAM-dependent methyltransferase